MGFVIPAHIMPSLTLYSSDVDYCVSLDRELYLFRSRRCSVIMTTFRPINWDAKAAPGSWRRRTDSHDRVDIHIIGVMVVSVVPNPESSKRDTKEKQMSRGNAQVHGRRETWNNSRRWMNRIQAGGLSTDRTTENHSEKIPTHTHLFLPRILLLSTSAPLHQHYRLRYQDQECSARTGSERRLVAA